MISILEEFNLMQRGSFEEGNFESGKVQGESYRIFKFFEGEESVYLFKSYIFINIVLDFKFGNIVIVNKCQ